MAQKAVKKEKVGVSGENFYKMKKEEILNSIILDPQKNQKLKEKGYRTYKGWAYVGGITGISYGYEVVAFQVLYNKMIDDGVITGKKIKEDGTYADETRAAIKNLQWQINEKTGMGILVDGYFGRETWSGTYALLTGDVGTLERVMEKGGWAEEKKVPGGAVKKPEEKPEEKPKKPKEEEDFYKKTKRITEKSDPNEKFDWKNAYAEELYDMGIVDMDDSGSYQLSDNAIEYLKTYNKKQKKKWKVTEPDLEYGINGKKPFTNKYAKALEYIVREYETAAVPGEGLPGLGEGRGGEYAPPEYGFEIPEEIEKIVESEKNEEDKEKMLAALKALKESENPEKIVESWRKLSQNSGQSLRDIIITAGSKLAG